MCQLVYTTRAYVQIYIHSNRAGSGSQRPELLQVVTVAAPTSEENPGSHRKVIIEPSITLVFRELVLSNVPLSGGAGRTQKTARNVVWMTVYNLKI